MIRKHRKSYGLYEHSEKLFVNLFAHRSIIYIRPAKSTGGNVAIFLKKTTKNNMLGKISKISVENG